jgi:diacylglycerol kinase (ATP)
VRFFLLVNPHSGRGRAERVAGGFQGAIAAAGHTCTRHDIGAASTADLAAAVPGHDALLVIGGDGTLHHAAPISIGTGVPIYHVPTGTENLFARQFRMSASPQEALRAAAARSIVRADAGAVNGHTFVIMCSIGPDAAVVRRVCASRDGAITRIAYAGPILRELRRPTVAPLTVSADGKVLIREQPGMLIIANTRTYAAGIDPGRRASTSDGLLDVVFFPGRSGLRLAAWVLASRVGRHIGRRGLVYQTARAIQVSSETPLPWQLDGESPPNAVSGAPAPLTTSLTIEVRPGVLPVLAPPEGALLRRGQTFL